MKTSTTLYGIEVFNSKVEGQWMSYRVEPNQVDMNLIFEDLIIEHPDWKVRMVKIVRTETKTIVKNK